MAGIKPAPATALRTNVGPEQITLSWTDNSRVESGYRLEYRRLYEGAGWTAAATVGADVTEHTISGLLTGERYQVRVIATASTGETPDRGGPSPPAPGAAGYTQAGGATYGGTDGTLENVRTLATTTVTTGEYGGSAAGETQYGGSS